VRIPQLEIIVDYRRAALYGVQPAAITEQLERLSNGRVVSRVIDGNRRFDVVLRLAGPATHHAGPWRSADRNADGLGAVRQIADVVETDGPNQILRENGRRRVVVLANTDGAADMARVVADIRNVLAAAKLPPAFPPASKARSRRRKSRCARSACCRWSRWR
jgi:Cu/Ag efflux pump CusA